jgi:hypothetical protein
VAMTICTGAAVSAASATAQPNEPRSWSVI